MNLILSFVLFAAAVGVIGGYLMQKGNPDGCGWMFLTIPMATIMAGIPAAILFTIADLPALDPALDWAGTWRTGLVAPLVLWVPALKKYRRRRELQRNRKRRPGVGKALVGPLIGSAVLAQLLVPVWLGAKWVSGA